jgi:flagellar basal body-associated protein FliL
MKFLTFISVCLAIVALGVLVVRYGHGFTFSTPPPSPPAVPTEGQGVGDVGPVVRLEPFVMSDVNDDGEHMSTVTFEVEVNDAQARDILKSRTSEIRSAILTVLADTKLSDIGVPEDFANLKKKVQSRIEDIVPDQVVRRVLITEFLSL